MAEDDQVGGWGGWEGAGGLWRKTVGCCHWVSHLIRYMQYRGPPSGGSHSHSHDHHARMITPIATCLSVSLLCCYDSYLINKIDMVTPSVRGLNVLVQLY